MPKVERGEFDDDCGVCALSTWASVAYDLSYDAIFPNGKPREDRHCPACGHGVGGHGTWPRQLRDAIARLGLGKWKWRRLSDWSLVPRGSLVTVTILDNGRVSRHWVVRDLLGRMRDCNYPRRETVPPNYHVDGYLEKCK